MPTRVAKRVASTAAVVGTLTKRERQLVATIFSEAANRSAKSVQVVSTPKGVIKTSVYLQWPEPRSSQAGQVDADTDMEEEEEEIVEAHEERAVNNASTKSKARVTIDPAAKQASKAHETFVVREPAKQTPTGKAKVQMQKVDKNTLSARSQPQPAPTKAPVPSTTLRPPPPPAGGPPPSLRLTLPPSQGDRQGEWQTVGRKQRSPPGSPSYASVLKTSRGSSEASEASDTEMSESHEHDSDPPAPEPELLTYRQALELWDEKVAAPRLAEGWTRKEVEEGRRPNPTRPGYIERILPEFHRPKKAEGMKTEKAWFG